MPFIPHTPESLIPRSDSRDPASTCRGVTATGRPCRRSVPGQSRTSNSPLYSARIHSQDTHCWQHKDQAIMAAASARATPRGLQSATIQERTSIDTLADRLGLVDLNSQDDRRKKPKEKPRENRLHPKSVPTHESKHSQSAPHRRSGLDLFFFDLGVFCCIRVEEDKTASELTHTDLIENKNSAPTTTQPKRQPSAPAVQERRIHQIHMKIPPTATMPIAKKSRSEPNMRPKERPPPIQHKSSPNTGDTGDLLSLIPRSVTPEITSLLLAELARPVSQHDEEGYIYMFWLTSIELPTTAYKAASSLLEPPTKPTRPKPGKRRTSGVLETFSTSSSALSSNKTIVLKIGRASNVQRRLNEWTRQCGYNLSLIRYYPYQKVGEELGAPTKVPHAHKVERLIHIELSGKRAQGSGKCSRCGSQHREWFEVEATRDGIKGVDEVIRRWVDWSLRTLGNG